MKRLLLLTLLCVAMAGQAQTDYWTSYNFVVDQQDVSAVYALVDDYYKANKPQGVSVRLFENHFRDNTNNYTHCLVFSGPLEAMGGMYRFEPSAEMDLFLARLNQHVKEWYSTSMGYGLAVYAGGEGPYPYRRMFMLDVADPAAFANSFQDFHSRTNPEGRMIFLGSIASGRSPEGENHFIIAAFKDFKTAMAGVTALVPEDRRDAYLQEWADSDQAGGGFRMVSSSLRILLGEW